MYNFANLSIKKDVIATAEESMNLGKKIGFKKGKLTLEQIEDKIRKLTPEKYTFGFIGSILKGSKKGNAEQFYYIAKVLGYSDDDFLSDVVNTIIETVGYNFGEAKLQEIIEKKFGSQNMDKINTLQQIDFEQEFIKEMALSREFRNNDKAIEEAKAIWKHLKDKYQEK